MTQNKNNKTFFYLWFLAIIAVFVAMMIPYINTIVLVYISSLILFPLYKVIYKKLKARKRRTPIAVTLTILLGVTLVIAPLIIIISIALGQALQLINSLTDIIAAKSYDISIEKLNELLTQVPYLTYELDGEVILVVAKSSLQSSVSILRGAIPKIGASAISFFMNAIVYFVLLAYLLPQTDKFNKAIINMIPLHRASSTLFLRRAHVITLDMIKSMFVVALVQGAAVLVILVILGVPYAILFTLIATFLAIIPYVGTALVMIPLAIYYLLIGDPITAIILILWQLLVVSLIDNLLRPFLVSDEANLRLPFALLGILGGMAMFGFIGIVYGPLIVVMLITSVELYQKEFLQKEGKKSPNQ